MRNSLDVECTTSRCCTRYASDILRRHTECDARRLQQHLPARRHALLFVPVRPPHRASRQEFQFPFPPLPPGATQLEPPPSGATQLETHDRVVFAGFLCSAGMARVRPRVIVSRKLAMPSIHHSCAQEYTVLTMTAHRDTDWVCRGVGQVSAGISRKQCETAQACAPCECKQRQEQRLHAKSYLVRLVKL